MLENKFFGEFPRLLFYTDVSQSPALLSNRAVASEKVLCRVLAVRCLCLRVGCMGHPTFLLYICLRVSYHLLRQMTGASEGSLEGSPTFLYYLYTPSFLRVSGTKGCCFRKGFRKVPPTVLVSPSLLLDSVLLEFSTSLINLHVYSVLAYPLFFFNMQLIRRDSISSSSHQMEVENMADVDYVLCKGSMA